MSFNGGRKHIGMAFLAVVWSTAPSSVRAEASHHVPSAGRLAVSASYQRSVWGRNVADVDVFALGVGRAF